MNPFIERQKLQVKNIWTANTAEKEELVISKQNTFCH